jgi:predicted DNA-binding helix-hairpin-helix protein
VRVNSADRTALLKVPGIGPETALRIIKTRKDGRITGPEAVGLKGKRFGKARGYLLFE